MGLFKKRSTDPGELDHLRSEIAAMAARLDAADAEKAQVDHRIAQLASKVDQPPPLPAAPPPAVAEVSQNDLDMIRARIQRLADRLEEPDVARQDPAAVDALERRVEQLAADLSAVQLGWGDTIGGSTPTIDPDEYAELCARVDALQSRFDTPIASPTAPPPPPPTAAVSPADIDDLRARIDALHERVGEVDARITLISTELANQIGELSGDIDALSRPSGAAADGDHADSIVGEIRDAQHRLANEQARYQIAFRQELAELAERLRRS